MPEEKEPKSNKGVIVLALVALLLLVVVFAIGPSLIAITNVMGGRTSNFYTFSN